MFQVLDSREITFSCIASDNYWIFSMHVAIFSAKLIGYDMHCR